MKLIWKKFKDKNFISNNLIATSNVIPRHIPTHPKTQPSPQSSSQAPWIQSGWRPAVQSGFPGYLLADGRHPPHLAYSQNLLCPLRLLFWPFPENWKEDLYSIVLCLVCVRDKIMLFLIVSPHLFFWLFYQGQENESLQYKKLSKNM